MTGVRSEEGLNKNTDLAVNTVKFFKYSKLLKLQKPYFNMKTTKQQKNDKVLLYE